MGGHGLTSMRLRMGRGPSSDNSVEKCAILDTSAQIEETIIYSCHEFKNEVSVQFTEEDVQ